MQSLLSTSVVYSVVCGGAGVGGGGGEQEGGLGEDGEWVTLFAW